MLRRAVQSRGVNAHQPSYRRNDKHDALFVLAEERAHGDAREFDRMVDVDVDFGVAFRFGIVPEVGPFLYQ